MQEQYNRDFIRQFGVPSGPMSWNTAKQVNAQIAPSALAGAERVEILTAWPGAKEASVLANVDASQAVNFNFDAPQGLDRVYVRTLDANGRVIADGYRLIKAAAMSFDAQEQAAEAVSVSLFDLTESPAFGHAVVTDRNRTLWSGFTNNAGESVYTPGSAPELVYPDYTLLNEYVKVKDPDNADESAWPGLPEDGYTLDYDHHLVFPALNSLTPASVATEFEIKVEYTSERGEGEDSWCAVQMANRTGVWTVYGDHTPSEAKGVDGECVFKLTAEHAARIATDGFIIQGHNVRLKNAYLRETNSQSLDIVRYADIFNIYGFTTGGKAEDVAGYIQKHLGPDNSYDPMGYSAADLVPLVGKSGVFHEEVNSEMKCNYELYSDQLHLKDGVEYRVVQDSQVGINFFYGCASYFNSLGYFYYTDAEANDEAALLRKPKFIIVANAYPGNNIKYDRGTEETPDFRHEMMYEELINTTDGIADGSGDGKDGGKPDEGKEKYMGNWAHSMLPKRLVDHFDPDVNGPAEAGYTGKMQSAYYKLVYYSRINQDGTPDESSATYTFPAGTHVAFFVIQGGYYWIERNGNTSQQVNNIRMAFSLPKLNAAIGNTFHTSHTHVWHKNGDSDPGYSIVNGVSGDVTTWTPFASYLWNGKVVMGVEDMPCEPETSVGFQGGDHDMNDLLFNVSGKIIREEDEEVNTETPKPMSWIVACEDLGVTDDFDFNDVVFGVSHVSGETTARVTALASGGTLPVYLWSKYPQLIDGAEVTTADGILVPQGSNGGEFHSWWGAGKSSGSVINARNYQHGRGAEITIAVPSEFSVSTVGDVESAKRPGDTDDNMGGFRVLVKKDGNLTTTITAPNYNEGFEAPQMFLVPSSWHWPAERQIITGVYPDFIEFTDGWWERKNGPDAENRIRHDWR